MAKKILVDGYAYSWRDLRRRLDRVRVRLPLAMADAARNFFVDSFKRQGWYEGTVLKKWKPRKKNKGRRRAILVKTGRLRKSIRIRRATFRRITIAAEAPYAAAHNFGVDETVTVRAHTRHTYTTVNEKYTTRTGKERSRPKRVETGKSYTVRSHTRHMQLPQRQFMGDSEMLGQDLARIVDRAVEEIFDR